MLCKVQHIFLLEKQIVDYVNIKSKKIFASILTACGSSRPSNGSSLTFLNAFSPYGSMIKYMFSRRFFFCDRAPLIEHE